MSDTDLPRPRWGVIDHSALTSRMPVRLTTPSMVADRPLPGFRAELVDEEFDSGIHTAMQKMICEVAAQQRDLIVTLQATASELGDLRGISVWHETIDQGDRIYCRSRYRLDDDVPTGEVRFHPEGRPR